MPDVPAGSAVSATDAVSKKQPLWVHKANDALMAAAATYPDAWFDSPWEGHLVAKVRKKVFVFFSPDEPLLRLTFKLPESHSAATAEPWCGPTGYGLGRSGWVSTEITRARDLDLPLMREWLDESYRAIAPVTLVRRLDSPRV